MALLAQLAVLALAARSPGAQGGTSGGPDGPCSVGGACARAAAAGAADEDAAMTLLQLNKDRLDKDRLNSTDALDSTDTFDKAGLNRTDWAPFPPCTITVWPALYAGSKMVLGTWDNMDPKLRALNLDFTGLWWMRGNPVPEVLASFAGTKASSATYPATLEIPNSLANQWSWKYNIMGTLVMKFYQLLGADGTMTIDMNSHKEGAITTWMEKIPLIGVEKWGMELQNSDVWLRPTKFKPLSPFPDTTYALTRILRADGSPTRYWEDFLKSSDAISQQSFGNSNDCMRLCELASPCLACMSACR